MRRIFKKRPNWLLARYPELLAAGRVAHVILVLFALGLSILYLMRDTHHAIPVSLALIVGLGFMPGWHTVIDAFVPSRRRKTLLMLRSAQYPHLNFFAGSDLDFERAFSHMVGKPERIIHSTVRHRNGMIYSAECPGRHHHVIHLMSDLEVGGPRATLNQGFLTSHGRYVDRMEGCKIARAQGQLIRKTGPIDELFSEDVWDSPMQVPPSFVPHSPGEPYFTLLARDPQAPALIEQWVKVRAKFEPTHHKIRAAAEVAASMRDWKRAHPDEGLPLDVYRAGAPTPIDQIAERALDLVQDAKDADCTVTIEQVSIQPPVMGSTTTRVFVRPVLSVIREQMAREREKQAVDETLIPTVPAAL